MKKGKLILFVLLMILVFSNTSQATNKKFNVTINGKKSSVKEVPIYVNGEKLKSEVSSFLLVDRTLVPIRFISENYGMTVEWENSTKTATVLSDSTKVMLKINSNQVLVNGEMKKLDNNSIPRLVTFPNGDARTMVPLRFISEIMGYEVGWNSEKGFATVDSKFNTSGNSDGFKPITGKQELKGIFLSEIINNQESVAFSFDSDTKYYYNYSEFDNKLFINVENASDGVYSKAFLSTLYANDKSYISDIEVREYPGSPAVLQIVVSLKYKTPYRIENAKIGKGIDVTFGDYMYTGTSPDTTQHGTATPSGSTNQTQTSGSDNITDASAKDKITKVAQHTISSITQSRESIKIEGAGKAKYNIIELKDPTRVVIDFMYAKLKGSNFQQKSNIGFVENIRVAQFSPDKNYEPDDIIVRVVMDIKPGIINPKFKFEVLGNDLFVSPEETIWDHLKYASYGSNSVFEIPLQSQSNYDVYYDNEVKALVISVPNGSVVLEDQITDVTDSLLKQVRVVTEGENKKFYLSFRRNVQYSFLSNKGTDSTVKLAFNRMASTNPKDFLIVLDPGHGGYDPGAISINKRNEKDVNLSVSLMVRDKLQAAGYNVYMTRSDDSGIGIYDRPRIANEIYPDVFVSIHANSVKNNSNANGIEVYYYEDDEAEKNRTDQKYLSKYIMEETVARTGAANRGVRSRGYVVVKYTNMPSSLIELGFLTNYEEEAKLFDYSYQEKLASGVAEGIMRYIREFK